MSFLSGFAFPPREFVPAAGSPWIVPSGMQSRGQQDGLSFAPMKFEPEAHALPFSPSPSLQPVVLPRPEHELVRVGGLAFDPKIYVSDPCLAFVSPMGMKNPVASKRVLGGRNQQPSSGLPFNPRDFVPRGGASILAEPPGSRLAPKAFVPKPKPDSSFVAPVGMKQANPSSLSRVTQSGSTAPSERAWPRKKMDGFDFAPRTFVPNPSFSFVAPVGMDRDPISAAPHAHVGVTRSSPEREVLSASPSRSQAQARQAIQFAFPPRDFVPIAASPWVKPNGMEGFEFGPKPFVPSPSSRFVVPIGMKRGPSTGFAVAKKRAILQSEGGSTPNLDFSPRRFVPEIRRKYVAPEGMHSPVVQLDSSVLDFAPRRFFATPCRRFVKPQGFDGAPVAQENVSRAVPRPVGGSKSVSSQRIGHGFDQEPSSSPQRSGPQSVRVSPRTAGSGPQPVRVFPMNAGSGPQPVRVFPMNPNSEGPPLPALPPLPDPPADPSLNSEPDFGPDARAAQAADDEVDEELEAELREIRKRLEAENLRIERSRKVAFERRASMLVDSPEGFRPRLQSMPPELLATSSSKKRGSLFARIFKKKSKATKASKDPNSIPEPAEGGFCPSHDFDALVVGYRMHVFDERGRKAAMQKFAVANRVCCAQIYTLWTEHMVSMRDRARFAKLFNSQVVDRCNLPRLLDGRIPMEEGPHLEKIKRYFLSDD